MAEYHKNEQLDTRGVTVTEHYESGSDKIITDGYKIMGFDSSVIGECVVTVEYKGKT